MIEEAVTKCPKCGLENKPDSKRCAAPSCHYYLKSEIECLRSMDRSLKGIRRIAIWFLVLSCLSLLVGLLAAGGAFR